MLQNELLTMIGSTCLCEAEFTAQPSHIISNGNSSLAHLCTDSVPNQILPLQKLVASSMQDRRLPQ